MNHKFPVLVSERYGLFYLPHIRSAGRRLSSRLQRHDQGAEYRFIALGDADLGVK
jgi:hypothetical protein